MKKLVWIGVVAGLAVSSYGQGKVTMNGTGPGAVLRFSNTVSQVLAGAATDTTLNTSYHVALYWGATAGDLAGPGGNIAGALAWVGTGATSGQLLTSTGGGNRTILDAQNNPVLTLCYFQLRAWTGNFATWADAKNSGDGSVFVSVIDPAAPGGAPIVSQLPQQSSSAGVPQIVWGGTAAAPVFVQLIPVPEPSTLALVGLGLLGLIFIRRRN